jgi:hypothetical protein
LLSAAVIVSIAQLATKEWLPLDAVAALRSADQATLYALEPWEEVQEGEPELHHYKVLGQTRIDGVALRRAASEFQASVERSGGFMAICFDPRHALTVTVDHHRFDFLLCYACGAMAVYRDGTALTRIPAAGSSKPMDALLAAVGLPHSQRYEEDAEHARLLREEQDLER